MATAMQRTAQRMKKQRQNLAMTRAMGMVAGASAPTAYIVLGDATGFAVAAFLAFAAAFLLVNSKQ